MDWTEAKKYLGGKQLETLIITRGAPRRPREFCSKPVILGSLEPLEPPTGAIFGERVYYGLGNGASDTVGLPVERPRLLIVFSLSPCSPLPPVTLSAVFDSAETYQQLSSGELNIVLNLGIGSPVNGCVHSLERLPPRLVVLNLGIGSPGNG